ncbi:hypothetical protein EDC96DRAFT_452187 [Choanephora cucurbitarum]|nr:hypothetical protein EDC96DRAFT_452187 [Choanephora cucurbitarum]
MSSDFPTSPQQVATSDFALCLQHERAKSIPMAQYNLNESLRIWLFDFEQQAKIHSIDNMDQCEIYLARYMPTLIQKWIPTLNPSIIQSWKESKQALLNRFGLPEEVDNQRLLQDLKRCKQ